jgi:predicted aspartyl protease
MALDTGATFSMVNNSALVLCGYNICDESEHVEVTTASGIELAPRIKVQSIRALGMQRSDFPILAHTLPARVGIDGLLGLDFLRGHKLEIDFRTGSLSID